MKRIFIVLFAVMAFVACDSKKDAGEQAAPAAESTSGSAALATGIVEVSAIGGEFDPAIQKSQLPDGVYFCDMGTVHYARGEQGDNKCPLCNMMLTYKKPAGEDAAAGAAEAEQPAEDHAGHDHE